MFEYPINSKHKSWDGLCQISTVVGNASVIEEHTRFTRSLGGSVVGVHGIWPKLTFWGGNGSVASKYVSPTHQLDNVKDKCEMLGIHVIQCQDFLFSGSQYNMAVDFLREDAEDTDVVLWLEGDECLNMDYFDWYIDTVKELKEDGYDGLIFPDLIELGPDRKWAKVWQTNQGFFFNKGLFSTRRTNFDGHQLFNTNTLKLANANDLGIPMMANPIHLHIFKQHGTCRVRDNKWHGGNKVIPLDQDIGDESYLNFIYDNLEIVNADLTREMDGYLGDSIYNS